MSGTIDMEAIRKLSVEERLKLMAAIWDTLSAEKREPGFSPEVDAELKRRAAGARTRP